MSFGDQLKKRREELGLSRSELADRLGVSRSAVGNYETGVSAPKEEVLLRLFDALHVEPNYLYRDAYRGGGEGVSDEERSLLEKYRRLGLSGIRRFGLDRFRGGHRLETTGSQPCRFRLVPQADRSARNLSRSASYAVLRRDLL